MPKQTFFNLPRSKREKLLAAIRAELGQSVGRPVSINRIIQAAGISRGSFYQYFEDREDMLAYLMEDLRLQMTRGLEALVERDRGEELFTLFSRMFEHTMSLMAPGSPYAFSRGLLADSHLRGQLFENHGKGIWADLLERYSDPRQLAALGLRDVNELDDLLGILFAVAGEAYAKVLLGGQCPQETGAQLNRRLALLRGRPGRV